MKQRYLVIGCVLALAVACDDNGGTDAGPGMDAGPQDGGGDTDAG